MSNELFTRYRGNPLLTANRWPYTISAVMNAGAAAVDDGTLLLCRVNDRRGISHLTVARSRDGYSNWVVEDTPLLESDPELPHEVWGLGDARLTWLNELESWVIAYTSFGPGGPSVSLATTRDFRAVQRVGMVHGPGDTNGAVFPRCIDGHFVMFHRPASALAHRADIWLSRSTDLHAWSPPEPVLSARPGGWWDSARVGVGPPPLETPEGWLVMYHGVRQTVAGDLYRVGLALLDLEQPTRVLRRSAEWVLGPREDYERLGDVPGVVFPTGLIHDRRSDLVRLYYGAADSCVAMATASLTEVVSFAIKHGLTERAASSGSTN